MVADASGGGTRRALRRSLVVGAIYDLLLAAWIAGFGPATFRALGATPPPPFFLHLALLPLVLLPALYLAAARARDVDPFRAPVLWARAGGGGVVLALVLWHRPDPAALYAVVGALDLAWCALHVALWSRESAAASR